jgi:hypothetical protein
LDRFSQFELERVHIPLKILVGELSKRGDCIAKVLGALAGFGQAVFALG